MHSPEELILRPTRRSWSRLKWDDPGSFRKLILTIIRTDDSLRTDQMLAAGDSEDILVKHGPALIDRVENLAKQNPRFAKILGGLWGWSRMSPKVWARLCAARDMKTRNKIHEGIID